MTNHTPADELRAAVRRLRSGMLIVRTDIDAPLAALLEAVQSNAQEDGHEECGGWCSPETCDLSAALAVARAVLSRPAVPAATNSEGEQ